MYRKALFAVSLIMALHLTSAGQANQAELQISAIGSIHYSAKSSFKPLNEFGINYQPYLFPRTYLVLGLQGNSRTYNEDNSDTLNTYTGTLAYSQSMVSVGVRHYFKEEIVETFNFFGEVNFHYMRLKTAGQYQGGGYGLAYYNYNRFKGMGLGFKLGTVYQRNSPWYFGANAALYYSGGVSGEKSDYTITPDTEPEILRGDLIDNKSFARFGIELRVGYRFFKK